MPAKPNSVKLNATSVDILNVIRGNASTTYQERIPEATRDNIREIGNSMMMYQVVQNEFLSSLINRIGRVIITSKMYSNPLKEFKQGILEYGESIEEIFVNIAKAHEFDQAKAEKEVFKREIPDVQAVFHRMNLKNFYKTTISHEMLRHAFLSIHGVTELIARIVDSLYTGAEFDEFLTMKQVIFNAGINGKLFPVAIPTVEAVNAKSIIATIKGISNKLEFMSADYNFMHVLTHTKKENQIILLDANFDAIIDVEVLAAAFNLEKAEFMGRRVLVDNFGGLENVVALLIDKSWFMIFDNIINFTEQYNGEGLYWNYWYHVWKTFSSSPFSNAVAFVVGNPLVNSVSINPTTATITKGQTAQFTVNIDVENYAPKSVIWELIGDGVTSVISTITSDGVIKINKNEENPTLTVKATSTFDNTKFGTAVINIV